MRMFGYYAFHTFINQLRKLCKTWVIILILVCVVIGGLAGFGLASLDSITVVNDIGDVKPEYDSEGVQTGRVYDEALNYYYQVYDVGNNYISLDIDLYGMHDRWCIVSTSNHYGTMNNTGREFDDEYTSLSDGSNPRTLTDQAGNSFTQLTEEELSEIGDTAAVDDPELLRSTLYRDQNQITYVLLKDDWGMFYVLPYIMYWDFTCVYDDLLDYDSEYLYYCQVYPDYDPDYLQEYTSFLNDPALFEDPDAVVIDQGGNEFTLPAGQTISISTEGIIESIAFLLALALLIYFVLSADKNGGRIFLMADVNALFASPLKPQSVLLFRLMMKLAVILIWVFYFGFLYSPELIDMGATVGGEALMLLTIALVIGYALVLQVMLYTISATNPKSGKKANLALAVLGLALLAGYTIYWKNSGLAPLPAFIGFLCNPALRFIPILGWGKAAAALSFSGNYAAAILWIVLLILGLTGLVIITWHIKADFYEDAMAKSEEIAALQQKAQERGSLFAFSNKKRLRKAEEREEREAPETGEEREAPEVREEREAPEAGGEREVPEARGEEAAGSDDRGSRFFGRKRKGENPVRQKTRRNRTGRSGFLARLTSDGLGHGWGASVYFWKAMHVRFRFGTFVYFTKTTFTYLALALGISLFGRLVLQTDLFLIGVMVIGIFAFYRCLGNALKEDISMDTFRLIPGSTWGKIFFSLLGILTNSLLDLIPAYLVLTIAFWAPPGKAIGFLVLTLSLQLYAIAVGAFMDVSIPINAGVAIKQTVQILFIYFGILPDAGILIWGMAVDRLPLAAVISFLVNLALTALFITLTANILEPKEGSLYSMTGENSMFGTNRYRIRKLFSRIGWGMLILYAASSAAQVVAAAIVGMTRADVADPIVSYMVTFLPEYLVGFPAGILFLRKLPATHTSGKDFTIPQMIKLFFITIFFGYTGSWIANLVNHLLTAIFGSGTSNVVANYVTEGTTLLQILFLCILAPCLEELFFRKIIIDRTRRFGEKNAVIFSAVAFGLFHGNLTQFIYAAAMGLVLAYVYLRTEKLRYSISLHMAFNVMGSIVAGKVSELVTASLETLGCPDAGTLEIIRMMLKHMNGSLIAADGSTAAINGTTIRGLVVYLIYLAVLILMWMAGMVFFLLNAKKIHFYQTEDQIPQGRTLATTWLNSGMIIFTLFMCLMMLAIIALGTI